MPANCWCVLGRTVAVAAALLVFGAVRPVDGQGGGTGGGTGIGNNFFGVVGGVQIDADGVVKGGIQQLDAAQRAELAAALDQASGSRKSGPGRRVVSLKQLESMLAKAAGDEQRVPLDASVLGGMQKIEAIVLDPANEDILLIGQGDDWTLNSAGAIVGQSNGQPVIHLEDLIVAMRTVDAANSGAGISVSIDPTAEGIRRVQDLSAQLAAGFSPDLAPAFEQAMGANMISLTGIPGSSRFAQVLVNADYRMKRLSMGLDQAPIARFPSVLEMLQQRDAAGVNASPRFWMECSYEPVARSEDGMVWQIRGQGVKTLTEDQVFDRNGQRQRAGSRNRVAENWAANMTERFNELAAADPAFAELRNIMDLTVVAAIIRQHKLLDEASADLPHLTGTLTGLRMPEYVAPKAVGAHCSFVRTSGSWIVSTSGGIQIDSWKAASDVVVDAGLKRESFGQPSLYSGSAWGVLASK